MKVISVWQPFASLAALGHKRIETRGYPAPKALIGERIGIASTKVIKPEQRAAYNDETFQKHYQPLGMPPLEELQHGYLLATVLLHSCDVITEEDLEDVTDEEQAFGWWRPGRYAWRLRDNEPLADPIRVSGQQGIWNLEIKNDNIRYLNRPR